MGTCIVELTFLGSIWSGNCEKSVTINCGLCTHLNITLIVGSDSSIEGEQNATLLIPGVDGIGNCVGRSLASLTPS